MTPARFLPQFWLTSNSLPGDLGGQLPSSVSRFSSSAEVGWDGVYFVTGKSLPTHRSGFGTKDKAFESQVPS